MITLLTALALHPVSAAVPPPRVAAGECFVMAPLNGAEMVLGGDECDRRTLPASTFKIPHALIALDTGVITDKTLMKWDGAKKDFPAQCVSNAAVRGAACRARCNDLRHSRRAATFDRWPTAPFVAPLEVAGGKRGRRAGTHTAHRHIAPR